MSERARIAMMHDASALPAIATWRSRVIAIRSLLEHFPMELLQLLFRISIASVFWNSGMTKIASWQSTIVLFRDEYKVPVIPPELAASLSATVELSTPVFLVLGLGTRLATLPLLGMTLVIQVFVYPENWVEHLTWASMLVFLLTRGPGFVSLDRWIAPLLLGKPREETVVRWSWH